MLRLQKINIFLTNIFLILLTSILQKINNYVTIILLTIFLQFFNVC